MRKLGLGIALVATTGCSLFNSFLGQATSNEGTNLANRAVPVQAAPAGRGGGMSSAMMANPAFLNMYMNVIFTYAFSSGGYDVTPVAYKPGQYTRWTGKTQDGKGIELERAFLFTDAKGNQWWKVKWTDEEQKTLVLEGLLNPKENRFVRMRAKFPDEAEGKELPVDESTYYAPPQKLSKESIEGATKGVETIKVPAGSFKATHVVFGGMGGTHEWWLDKKVPGGTVRKLMKNPKGDDEQWDMQLQAYGNDARTELGSR